MADDGASPQAELITIQVGAQRFAIDIMAVREIRGWTQSTRLPHAPPYVLGMINLRGAVLPVLDLGAKLGLGATAAGTSSVVVVVEVQGRQLGLVVDAVCDIITLTEGAVQPPPEVGEPTIREVVWGVVNSDEGIVTLLSLDAVLPQAVEIAA